LKTFAQYFTNHGEVRTASQYEHLLAGYGVIRPQGMEFVLQDSTDKKKKKSQPSKSVSKNDKKSKVSPANEVKKVAAEVSEKVLKPSNEEKEDLPERREEFVKMVQKFVDSDTDTVFRLITLISAVAAKNSKTLFES
jgi:predicted ATP-binding protein involved in virulence